MDKLQIFIKENKKIIILGVAILALFLVAIFFIFFGIRKNRALKTINKETIPVDIAKDQDLDNFVVEGDLKPEWVQREQVEDLGLLEFLEEDAFNEFEFKYYLVAKMSGGRELYLATKSDLGLSLYRFIKMPNGDFVFIKNNSDTIEEGIVLTSKVKVDKTSLINELALPKEIKHGSATFIYKNTGYTFFEDIFKDMTKITSISQGLLYVRLSNSNYGMQSRDFYLSLADGTYANYGLSMYFYDDQNGFSGISVDGQEIGGEYTSMFMISGCGGVDSVIIKNSEELIPFLSAIGQTSRNQDIYTFSEKNLNIVQDLYSIYKSSKNERDIYEGLASIDEFINLRPPAFFLIKDDLGEYVVYLNRDNSPLGGCGKPVIYLYPNKKIDFSVKVGANVTISEPFYKNGWKGTAYPNGDIFINGIKWPYLFWEGQGNGQYPPINRGVIVEKKDIEKTLKSHLNLLGLNKKESADFMDFWLERMPNTPYTRITWILTDQMNIIAPLTISPEPNTLIRVFLDFEGLDRISYIKPQHLSSVPRNGFTVVEWGGLLN
jgi:hypothetical protein